MPLPETFCELILADAGDAIETELAKNPGLASQKGRNSAKHPVFFNRTPLMAAAACGKAQAVKTLLPCSNQLSQDQNNGALPLAAAANGKHAECLSLLLAGLDSVSAQQRKVALEKTLDACVRANASECLILTLEKAAKEGFVFDRGFSLAALRKSAQLGRTECAQAVVERFLACLSPPTKEEWAIALNEATAQEATSSQLVLNGKSWPCSSYLLRFVDRETVKAAAARFERGLREAWARIEREELNAIAAPNPRQTDSPTRAAMRL